MPLYDLSDAIGRGALSSRPAFGIPGRLYFATDEALLYRDSGTAWESVEADHYTQAEVNALLAQSVPSTQQTGSFLLSGGQVVWESGLVFRISAAEYFIQSTRYTAAEQAVTLDAADGTYDRIDVIALNTAGSVVKVTGTPAESPSRPDVDPETQLQLTFVLVLATATEPSGIATVDLYLENAGTPTEWAATSSGAAVNVDSANNPRTGTKCIELTAAGNTDWLQLAAAAPVLLTNEFLVLYVRSKAAWPAAKSIRLSFRLNGVLAGNYVTLDDGLWGFASATLGSYQQVAIPLTAFAVPSSSYVNQLRVEVRGSGGAIGAYFDDILLQGGAAQAAAGITQEQADARYVQIAGNYAGIEPVFDGGGSALTTGVKLDLVVPFNCVIESWTLLADQSGAIKIDIWRDTYANYPPTDADSITNAHEPEIAASGVNAQDLNLSDWTSVTLVKGQTLRFNIDSVATIQRATLALLVRKT
jgi:hypothetical protein